MNTRSSNPGPVCKVLARFSSEWGVVLATNPTTSIAAEKFLARDLRGTADPALVERRTFLVVDWLLRVVMPEWFAACAPRYGYFASLLRNSSESNYESERSEIWDDEGIRDIAALVRKGHELATAFPPWPEQDRLRSMSASLEAANFAGIGAAAATCVGQFDAMSWRCEIFRCAASAMEIAAWSSLCFGEISQTELRVLVSKTQASAAALIDKLCDAKPIAHVVDLVRIDELHPEKPVKMNIDAIGYGWLCAKFGQPIGPIGDLGIFEATRVNPYGNSCTVSVCKAEYTNKPPRWELSINGTPWMEIKTKREVSIILEALGMPEGKGLQSPASRWRSTEKCTSD